MIWLPRTRARPRAIGCRWPKDKFRLPFSTTAESIVGQSERGCRRGLICGSSLQERQGYLGPRRRPSIRKCRESFSFKQPSSSLQGVGQSLTFPLQTLESNPQKQASQAIQRGHTESIVHKQPKPAIDEPSLGSREYHCSCKCRHTVDFISTLPSV